MNGFFRAKFSLVAQIPPQVCVYWTQPIQYGDSGRLNGSPLGLGIPELSLKGSFLDLALHGKAKLAHGALALLLERS